MGKYDFKYKTFTTENFNYLINEKEVIEYLELCLGSSIVKDLIKENQDIEIDKLIGRIRLSALTIENLSIKNDLTKVEKLKFAINESYLIMKNALYEKMKYVLSKKKENILAIEKILISSLFCDSFQFEIDTNVKDLMDIGILPIIIDYKNNPKYLAINESLAIEACILWWSDNKKTATNYVLDDAFKTIEKHFQKEGLRGQTKGVLFETFVSSIFTQKKFQGVLIYDLPFIKCFQKYLKTDFPSWMKELEFICEINPNLFDTKLKNDCEVIKKIFQEKISFIFKTSDLCGLDKILVIFKDDKFYLIIISFKIYSTPIEKNDHITSVKQTNINYIYSKKINQTFNGDYLTFVNTEKIIKENFIVDEFDNDRKEILDLLNKNSGTLRLHIELPCTSFDNKIEKIYVNNNEVNILLTEKYLNTLISDKRHLNIFREIWKRND